MKQSPFIIARNPRRPARAEFPELRNRRWMREHAHLGTTALACLLGCGVSTVQYARKALRQTPPPADGMAARQRARMKQRGSDEAQT